MPFTLFQYSIPAPDELNDLNTFLSSQKVASVTHHMVSTGNGAMPLFVGETASGGADRLGRDSLKERVDYKTKLSDDEFVIFNRLRDERKKIADSETVQVYNVFTNARLAQMVTQKTNSISAIEALEGVGKSRVQKYGNRFLMILHEYFPLDENANGKAE